MLNSNYWTLNSGNGTIENPYIGISTNNGIHNSIAYIEFIVTGSGYLSYSVRVSSEANFDYLNMYVDSQRIVRISGIASREGEIYANDGTIIRIEYTKDASVNSNSDRGYLESLYVIE